MTDLGDHDADLGGHDADLRDHDADLRDHDGPIRAITMGRFPHLSEETRGFQILIDNERPHTHSVSRQR
ncbi:hypothetical protein OV203_38585 [Nannocystis sp. ILAH1]|uniref:hypothetical protein n=1 Tax=Nannocystis sp. ILAH1 TaxID=2996789 RepID=UPI00226EBC65|nr:hypothetical protein [Nannocystis sp. ILAH1]MCY0993112.1 hypothetical protein [Nannocystis sp. ILAH1]